MEKPKLKPFPDNTIVNNHGLPWQPSTFAKLKEKLGFGDAYDKTKYYKGEDGKYYVRS